MPCCVTPLLTSLASLHLLLISKSLRLFSYLSVSLLILFDVLIVSFIYLFIFVLVQFGHGQSNPTFLLEAGSGGIVKRYVLRKKPPGKLLPSAHAVDREFQVTLIIFHCPFYIFHIDFIWFWSTVLPIVCLEVFIWLWESRYLSIFRAFL